MHIKALRGTTDILSPAVEKWQAVETVARDVFRLYGFKEIRTPLLEETILFTRSLGEVTDIVEKQMYSFTDRGERSISLRPEGTASVVRAYVEHHLAQRAGVTRLFYIGPMFRAERPQAGRYRQFHQIGGEAIGSYEARLDAEILSLISFFFERLGLTGHILKLNTLGCKEEDKKTIDSSLKEYPGEHRSSLCEDCRRRFEKNIYRILDCKEPGCQKIVQNFPPLFEKICQPCKEHFEKVKQALSLYKIDYVISPHLVRGLDYYTQTAFEITHPLLGAQDAIAAGGRYNNLVTELGGGESEEGGVRGSSGGAIGFSIGFERLIMVLEAQKMDIGKVEPVEVFIATIGEKSEEESFRLLNSLRSKGISCLANFDPKTLKAQMRLANALQAKRVLIIGEDELKENVVTLREMATSKEEKVHQDILVKEILRRMKEEGE